MGMGVEIEGFLSLCKYPIHEWRSSTYPYLLSIIGQLVPSKRSSKCIILLRNPIALLSSGKLGAHVWRFHSFLSAANVGHGGGKRSGSWIGQYGAADIVDQLTRIREIVMIFRPFIASAHPL